MMAAPVFLQRLSGLFDYYPAFVRQGYIKLKPFSSRCLPIRSRDSEPVFFTHRKMSGHDVTHVFRLSDLIFRKNNGITASAKTLMRNFDSRYMNSAAQYFNYRNCRTENQRLLNNQINPDFQATGQIASIFAPAFKLQCESLSLATRRIHPVPGGEKRTGKPEEKTEPRAPEAFAPRRARYENRLIR
ncbi:MULTISPECIES: hypothetical protein [Burkholderia]|uniref:hypothetical protein n=1 Tax=Burkholderia TaxID=32008 RepID=UPI000A4A353F|nr:MULTISPECIES: hypothetical protein [Burkholderia]MBN3741844.1 hypothetical protein [Burkholderia sp. Tr-20355]